jgi:hypothetical protein
MLIPLGILAASGAGAAGAYELIESSILLSDTASVTFSSIPQDYKHLQIRLVGRATATGTFRSIETVINGDTGSNYRWHLLEGTGSSVASQSYGPASYMPIGQIPGTGIADAWAAVITDYLDYSSSSKNTTVRTLHGFAGSSRQIVLQSGLWMNTAAVTQILLRPDSNNWLSGTRISLYGIRG